MLPGSAGDTNCSGRPLFKLHRVQRISISACWPVHDNVYCCNTTQHNTTQHNTTQHNTTQHTTTQHSTIQHNTVRDETRRDKTRRHSTVKYSTVQYNTIEYNTSIAQHNTTQNKHHMLPYGMLGQIPPCHCSVLMINSIGGKRKHQCLHCLCR